MTPPWLAARLDAIAVDAVAPAPSRADWLITGLLAVALIGETATSWPPSPTSGQAASAAAIALLPWRRRAPLFTTSVAAIGYLAVVLPRWGQGEQASVGTAGQIALILLCYALCRWAPPARLAAGVLVVLTAALAGGIAESGRLERPLADAALVWGPTILVALAVRHRARLLRRQLEGQLAGARLHERHELARELHDLVAHHVSAIAVQAQAARVVGDPAVAASTLAAIERTASTALSDMRRMVGILRSDERPAAMVGPSGPSGLAGLVDPDASPPVTLDCDVDLDTLPDPVAGAVYRIAQEAITNARRHSRHPTAVEVAVRGGPHHVEVEITDDGVTRAGGGHGFGLVGMRERVEAFGGSFSAGPRPCGGWSVHATIPLGTGAQA